MRSTKGNADLILPGLLATVLVIGMLAAVNLFLHPLETWSVLIGIGAMVVWVAFFALTAEAMKH